MDEDVIRAVRLIDQQPTASGRGVVGDLQRVCGAAVGSLAAHGAAVSVMAAGGVRGVTTASDAAAEWTEELQFALGEGPCIEAFTGRRPVLVPDLEYRSGSWPVYVSAVVHRGVRAVFAFPLQIGAARLGVFDVFRSRVGRLSTAELGMAVTFAEVAVLTLLDGQRRAATGTAAEGLDEAFDLRAELFQAQGMAMIQLGVDPAEAWERIRAHAYANARSLAEVARDIVARRLRFDRRTGDARYG